jgi:hypothetical protein
MRKRVQTRRLATELLENRSLLAGNVTANIEGGILYLQGDSAANGVSVHQSGANYEIVGTPVAGKPTTINGSASFTATGVNNGITANLNGGADQIHFANGASPISIPGALVVQTGDGNDSVSGKINNTGAVTFNLGSGADQAYLSSSSLATLVINADPLNNTGAGADQVTLNGVVANAAAVIRTGAGNDVVKVVGASSFPLSLTISVDDGDDRVDVLGTASQPISVGGAFTVNAGHGDDVVNAQYVNVNGAATVTNFTGDSTVKLDHINAVDGLYAFLGADDDSMTVSNSTASIAVLVGWLGTDTLSLSNDNFDTQVVLGF